PLAHPALQIAGVLRAEPEGFFVDELLAFAPSGEGDHLLLRIEKRDMNSHDVATELARLFDVAPVDVSFAGMKDRRAVTRQWFSVRTVANGLALRSDRWRVIETARHVRKLRRGELVGNAFRLRLRAVEGDPAALDERLAVVCSTGVPNYFGEQRFGHNGA